jgi:dynein assembly factor with WDR repeat domains 1
VDQGKLLTTFRGHKAELVCVTFDPTSTYLVTGSMDRTAIVWNLETEQQLMNIDSHTGEVISISFNSDGDKLLTGSFDYTAKVFTSCNSSQYYIIYIHRSGTLITVI